MKYGQVWLVGAGPGDAGLLTLKGLDVINKADVVVYDKLVGHGVMSLIPKTCELIYVGKSSGNHLVPQEEINQIILDNALKGKNVVRLKGGDPFLFGRGAEEIELLYENNVEFEVVPGITSAISAPAYGGIPITHRDFASSVHIITGHFRDNSNSEIDFKSLVKVKGTLVFLMGISSLNIISSGLINGGMNEDMPCAIIQSGTTSKQRKVVSTIKNIEADARKKSIKSPGVIVVGEVCTLSEKFSWYENLSLHGMKILVTRPSELSSRLSSKLYNKGAEVVNMPS
ncbi:MAG: uroporphyrinogen-III C-methyltransferase, partial [Clostridium sp.]